jgi:hypothetical protein
VLPDAALRSIADSLAALRLDPVLHLKVAVVAPLMGGEATVPSREPAHLPKIAVPRKAAAAKKAAKRKAKPEIAFEGETYSRTAQAGLLATRFERSASAVIHMLRAHNNDPTSVVALPAGRHRPP